MKSIHQSLPINCTDKDLTSQAKDTIKDHWNKFGAVLFCRRECSLQARDYSRRLAIMLLSVSGLSRVFVSIFQQVRACHRQVTTPFAVTCNVPETSPQRSRTPESEE